MLHALHFYHFPLTSESKRENESLPSTQSRFTLRFCESSPVYIYLYLAISKAHS